MVLGKSLDGRRGKKALRARYRRRRLGFSLERLEHRHLLAGDLLPCSGFAEPFEAEGEGSYKVAITLRVTDLNGNPISAVRAGEQFLLNGFGEDLRDTALGLFSTYVDVDYSPSLASVSGPLEFHDGFINGKSGDTDMAGVLDEVGAFRDALVPPQIAISQFFSLPMTASGQGELTFDANPADVVPGHGVLLYGFDVEIAQDEIQYGSTSIEVLQGGPGVQANDDYLGVYADSRNNALDVLRNDTSSAASDLMISSVDTSGLAGQVTIVADAMALLYTPPPGFVGTETFSYDAVNAEGIRDTGEVTVAVKGDDPDTVVEIELVAVDEFGTPISTAPEGSVFEIQAVVTDVRDVPEGVFAAYADMIYNTSLVSPGGPIEFGNTFPNGRAGDLGTPGVANEVGGFADLNPTGPGSAVLFSIPFNADAAGHAVFRADPADVMPTHATLVYGSDAAVSTSMIQFVSTVVEVIPDVIAVDDSYTFSGSSIEIPVLENDIDRSAGSLSIVALDTAGLMGRVEISSDGESIVYLPADDFEGTDQFRYTVAGSGGSDSAQVTVHVQPGAASDDLLSISLLPTDLGGNPITSIAAGSPFRLSAFVKDLRGADVSDRGVFAAYFDLLYDASAFSVVPDATNRLGFDIDFDADYSNGMRGRGGVPGILDEVGAFQTSSQPLGDAEFELFRVTMKANTASGQSDAYTIDEDSAPILLDVLLNDVPNEGTSEFRTDPADVLPASDVLLFDPTRELAPSEIRFGESSLQVISSRAPRISDVSPTTRGGTVEISGDGVGLVYTPAPNFYGTDTFTYTIDDTSTVDVRVVVKPIDDAPVGAADHYTVRADERLVVSAASGVLANDDDVDGDVFTASLVQQPSFGNVEFNADGSFEYVPATGFSGTDSFAYVADDGKLISDSATVQIDVLPPPVRIRLEVTDLEGQTISAIPAGQPFLLTAYVTDLRGNAASLHGVGAAYVDVSYDANMVNVVTSDTNPLGFDVEFGSEYQNGKAGSIDVLGLIDDIGAFQTDLVPTGDGELELFQIAFEASGLQAADDLYVVSRDSRSSLDVLLNESEIVWTSPFSLGSADNSPITDVIYFDPPVKVDDEDIGFIGADVGIKNDGNLTIVEVSETTQGGAVTIVDGGTQVQYTSPPEFTGTDSFEYTVVDEAGNIGTAEVVVDVVDSWQNQFNPYDVNSDGLITSFDALAIINDLNTAGPRQLPPLFDGSSYYDVNGDGFISPQDVLLVMNYLNDNGPGVAKYLPSTKKDPADGAAEGEGESIGRLRNLVTLRPDVPDESQDLLARISPSESPLDQFGLNDDTKRPKFEFARQVGRIPRPAPQGYAHVEQPRVTDDIEELLDDLADDISGLWS